MKERMGFVTNSSSSSFIINKKNLTSKQVEAIDRHDHVGDCLGLSYAKSDSWIIRESKNFISGYTDMDNFCMYEFLQKIGVDLSKVTWGEFSFDIDDFESGLETLEEKSTKYEERNINWEQFLEDDNYEE